MELLVKTIVLNIHPFVRENNWITRNLVLAGNFNLTNVDELFQKLVELGQYPGETLETVTILEKIGHFLDDENERIFKQFKAQGLPNKEISHQIAETIDMGKFFSNLQKIGMEVMLWQECLDMEMPSF